MKLSKLVSILTKRRDIYQANADALDWIITLICTLETRKEQRKSGHVLILPPDRELEPDESFLVAYVKAVVEDSQQ